MATRDHTPEAVLAEVTQSIRAVLQPTGDPVPTRLRWTPTEPLAVALVFTTPAGPVVWLLARELLAAGLRLPAGTGDVRLEPFVDDVLVTLDNSRQRATLLLPGYHVARFLTATYAQLPLGCERVDVDLELALLSIDGGAR